jgi:flagellar biogenesis protein FliO
VIGAQIVSVPARVAAASADNAFRTILLWLGGILGLILVATNILVAFLCSRRPRAQS